MEQIDVTAAKLAQRWETSKQGETEVHEVDFAGLPYRLCSVASLEKSKGWMFGFIHRLDPDGDKPFGHDISRPATEDQHVFVGLVAETVLQVRVFTRVYR